MKKIINVIIGFMAVAVITIIAVVVRVYNNFKWVSEESGIKEEDVIFFEYDGVRYNEHELNDSIVSEWTDENLFSVGMNIDFPCGDALKVRHDYTGTEWVYSLFGMEIDISKFVFEETEVEHRTVYEEIHGIA